MAFCYVRTECSPRTENSLSVVFLVREGPLGNSPDSFVCVTEVISQIKLSPQEIFWCNRLAIENLITHRSTHYITQINLPENLFVYM